MKKVGIVSYNLHYNYSNYGSILQTYALQNVIRSILDIDPVVINYCPSAFRQSNPLNALENISNKDSTLYGTYSILLNDIKKNEIKIREFVNKYYNCSSRIYYEENFQDSLINEGLAGYICGSDAIWSYEYFKTFDDAFYGNYTCMKNSYTIAYAASFGETVFSDILRDEMLQRMKNFKAIGVRESTEIDIIKKNTEIPVNRVLDPTFLLKLDDYKKIMTRNTINCPYLLIYSRKYNSKLYETANIIAKKMKLRIVEISLNIKNCEQNIMKYSAGVEEFLSLVYYSRYVVTNSLHGTIFSIIMKKDFYVYPRLHGDKKITELLDLLDIKKRILTETIDEESINSVDYYRVEQFLNKEICMSKHFLYESLKPLL